MCLRAISELAPAPAVILAVFQNMAAAAEMRILLVVLLIAPHLVKENRRSVCVKTLQFSLLGF